MNMAACRETKPQDCVPVVPLAESNVAAYAARGAEAERERLREALHDGLGQLLTSISFLAGSLRAKLAARDLPEAGEAEDIMALIRQAIYETQNLVTEQEKPTKDS